MTTLLSPLTFIRRELDHLGRLQPDARSLLLAICMYGATNPLLFLFANAFLWVSSPDIALLSVYNIALFFAIPVGFFAAGYLMRWIGVKYLHGIGFIGQAISVASLVVVASPSYLNTAVFGSMFGLIAGVYWGARNLLSITLTSDRERDYFFGLESAITTVLGVMTPALFGVLIEYQFFLPASLTQRESYLVLLGIGIFGISLASWKMLQGEFTVSKPQALLLNKVSLRWSQARTFILVKGIANGGATFLPALLVLSFFQGQGDLGSIQSLGALVTAVLVYVIGRATNKSEHRLTTLAGGTAALVLGGLALMVLFNQLGVAIFTVLYTFGWQLTWNASNPIAMRALEVVEPNKALTYAYLCDRETFLSIGRTVGILGFLAIYFLDPKLSLRITPLLLGIAQLFVLRIGSVVSREE